jgi:hypothetical protein
MLYNDLTDEELAAKKKELVGKYETAIGGGVATVIAGEGRRVEYTRANASGLESLIKALDREQQKRAGVQVSGAIRVTFPYSGDYNGW